MINLCLFFSGVIIDEWLEKEALTTKPITHKSKSRIFNKDVIKEKIIENLKKVYDPEIPVDIYSLGLIYNIELEERENYLFCEIDMTLTSPACPVADSLLEQVRYVAMAVDEVDEAKVNLVFEPVWEPHMMSEEAKEVMGASGAAISW